MRLVNNVPPNQINQTVMVIGCEHPIANYLIKCGHSKYLWLLDLEYDSCEFRYTHFNILLKFEAVFVIQ